ncbi:hypothetical protein [Phenylobacterium sp.]|jgi:hypothetical protein
MSDPHEPAEPDPTDRRNRLAGRLLIVALGVLLAAYAAVTFLR